MIHHRTETTPSRVQAKMAEAFQEIEGSICEARVLARLSKTLAEAGLERFVDIGEGERGTILAVDDAEALLWMVQETAAKLDLLRDAYRDLHDAAQRP